MNNSKSNCLEMVGNTQNINIIKMGKSYSLLHWADKWLKSKGYAATTTTAERFVLVNSNLLEVWGDLGR